MVDHSLPGKISEKAPKVWRMTELISDLIGIIILAVIFFLDAYFDWVYWIGWILIALTIVLVLGSIWGVIEPDLLYKSWYFKVDEEFFQIKKGIWKEQWVTIPMTKIQGVSTTQGPILRRYQLRSITVETMGSSYSIPALEEKVAYELRDNIAEYAKIKEVEQT
ncbi:PH domain-containing protein [Gracilibacillus dipsosauri]|uniref:PH domain-containing protein n=1 Tax=Gracilibacillus dipsosauri TaxID=178340 RepID=UPI00240A88B0